MRRNDQNSTSGQILNSKFETPRAVSCRLRIFGVLTARFMRVLCENGFCNAKFWEFGG